MSENNSASAKGNKKPKNGSSRWTDEKIRQVIDDAVLAGREAGRKEAVSDAKTAFSYTEKRLRAYPALQKKINTDREYLEQVQIYGTPERSKSIIRYSQSSGSRVAPEEKLEAAIAALKAEIARNEYEADTIKEALDDISDDPYYYVLEQRYFHDKTDEEIAKMFKVDRSTVWRNRARLVEKLAVRFFGSVAFV